MLGVGIRNIVQGNRDPNNDWSPKSNQSSADRESRIEHLESVIHGLESRTQTVLVLDYLVYIGRTTLPQTTICTTWLSQYRRNSTVHTKTSRFMSGSSTRLNSSDFSFIHRVLGMLKLVKLLRVTSSICLFAVFSIMWWWKSGQKSNVPESWRKSYQRLQLKKQTASLSTLQ